MVDWHNSSKLRPAVCCDAGIIDTIPLFSGLHSSVLSRLASISRVVDFAAGSNVCEQDDAASDLFFVLEGKVSLINTAPNGETVIVEVIQEGGYFGLAPVLARMPYLATAKAVTTIRLLMMDGRAINDLVQVESALLERVIRAEALDFSSIVQQVCDLKFRTTSQRLACYLLNLVSEKSDNGATFRLPFDKRLLAGRIGCRQENLSRAFAALRAEGVETHGASVVLHDIERLKRYALGNPAHQK